MKYAWIKRHRKQFPVAVMCRALKVSSSGYYDSIKRKPCQQQIRRQSIAQAAAVSYFESRRIYGYRKVYEDLANRNPGPGLIHHSDRGVQYASGDFQDPLKDSKAICSMSGKVTAGTMR